jgi:hypothetical protein
MAARRNSGIAAASAAATTAPHAPTASRLLNSPDMSWLTPFHHASLLNTW